MNGFIKNREIKNYWINTAENSILLDILDKADRI
jgi:hypothetical protein